MNKTDTRSVVEKEVDKLLDAGFTDKNEIIQKVSDYLGITRPTVRRIVRDMRNEMTRKIRILEADFIKLPE